MFRTVPGTDKHPETLTVISSDEEMFCFSTKKKKKVEATAELTL